VDIHIYIYICIYIQGKTEKENELPRERARVHAPERQRRRKSGRVSERGSNSWKGSVTVWILGRKPYSITWYKSEVGVLKKTV